MKAGGSGIVSIAASSATIAGDGRDVQGELAERHRLGMRPPREMRLRYPLEHARVSCGFLFELGEQSIDDLHVESS